MSRKVNGESIRHLKRWSILGLAVFALIALIAPATSQAAPKKVRVMTRNLYLGADLSPGTSATSLQELANAAGQIINEVDQNDFSVRAQGLAREIRNQNPDLVGLQEGALWRQDNNCATNPIPPSATQVHQNGDFLQLLLDAVNQGPHHYSYAVVQPEFDFQVWANTDGDEMTGTPFGCEFEGRLTMRDAILVRDDRVQVTHPQSDSFDTLLQVTPGGVPINVTRGWTAVDAKVDGAPKFRFVNTHFEAFDNQPSNHTNQNTDVGNGRVRLAQAKELVANGGPATGSLPVVLAGDLNSDVRTPLKPGDQLAHGSLLHSGFVERATYDPLGCCLNSSLITDTGGGSVADFDHKVDHVMTDDPAHVTLVRSDVTGRQPVNGFWDSDHAGIASVLNFK